MKIYLIWFCALFAACSTLDPNKTHVACWGTGAKVLDTNARGDVSAEGDSDTVGFLDDATGRYTIVRTATCVIAVAPKGAAKVDSMPGGSAPDSDEPPASDPNRNDVV